MSAYAEYEVEFKDEEALIAALQEVSWRGGVLLADQIKRGEALPLFGYQGDNRTAAGTAPACQIVIPRRSVGSASNDIGFYRTENGTFKAVISSFDSHHHNAEWMGSLKAEYAAVKAVNAAKLKGYSVVKTKENGKIQIKCSRYR